MRNVCARAYRFSSAEREELPHQMRKDVAAVANMSGGSNSRAPRPKQSSGSAANSDQQRSAPRRQRHPATSRVVLRYRRDASLWQCSTIVRAGMTLIMVEVCSCAFYARQLTAYAFSH